MSDACPSDADLEGLLADQLTEEEEAAMEPHVASCSECQHRLEQLTGGKLALAAGPAANGLSLEDARPVLEQVANISPAQARFFAKRPTPERHREEASPAQTPNLRSAVAMPQPPDVVYQSGGQSNHDAAWVPPPSFGRYEVRRPLGSGGCGSVYLAHDRQLDRPVAIKVIRGGPDAPTAESERLLREARRLAQLRHPGIVTVHDVGVHEGQLYIVSDFIDGPSLGEWLRGNRPTWLEAAGIAAAVADALAHAHARLIIHRDVKPANIMLTPGRKPVLVDFGLALDEAGAGGREIGVVAGTPLYMSPEQIAGVAHRIDGRTDIYSLGVVLYEMLCGREPFRSDDLGELLRQVHDDEPQPPRQLVPDLPPELERVCLKALAKHPPDRYSTAADLAADLRRLVPPSPTSTLAGEQRKAPETSSSEQRARDAELHQVTVLACGCALFDSEEYAGGIDTEGQARVFKAFVQSCEQVASRYDGAIVQCNQQGLLVCFGYPVAYEDAPRRAARTGLDILDNLKGLGEQLGREHDLELGPWVGIHTGQACAETSDNGVSLVGEAPNVAVRLKDGAERGQVVCTEATYVLIRSHFECAGLGSRKVKGVPRPVALFAVRAAVGNLLEARSDALTPLIGREHKVSLLLDRWEQAREGPGQVVLLVGEPGLGKSRLAYTLTQHIQGQRDQSDSTIIEWRCSPYYQNTLLYPARDSLERLLGLGHEEVPATAFDCLVRHLAKYDLARPEVVPLFAALLSLPTDERFPPLGLSPIREREKTFWALQQWLLASAEQHPVLFVVEDLHWADPSTQEFLRQFVAEGQHDRALTLLTFRPEFQPPWPEVAHQTRLALSRLTRSHVGEMMRRMLEVETLPEAIVDLVYDRSGGVPLFVEEFVQVVQESGLLDRMESDGARMLALLAHTIPASLRDLVMARLDRLAGDREVAQMSAALGREFNYDLLAAVTTLQGPALQAELTKLVQGGILHQRGRWPTYSYVFRHALLQDSVYKTLIKGKRQQIHSRIAEALEAEFPRIAQAQPELLAHHCTEADLTEKAIGYWLTAGLRSRDRFANDEAIGHLTLGMELLATLAESPERDAQELQFLNALGAAYQSARGYGAPEAGRVFRRARELCDRIGQPVERFAAMWGAWAWHTARGDLRLCMKLADEAVNYAGSIDDPGMKMEALFLTGFTMFYRADFAGARDHCGRAVADYDDRGRTKKWATYLGQDSGVTHRLYLALALWHLGYPDQALSASREALTLARIIGHPCTLGVAGHHTAWLYQACRLGTEAVAATEEESAISAEQGFALWRATAMLDKGAGIVLQGRPEEALPLLVKGLDDYRATGCECSVPYYLSMLGDAYVQVGRFQDAREALDEGLAIAEKNDDRVQEAELYRLKGELLLVESENQAAAEDCFRLAIETARRQQSRAWELRATMSLARLWQRQGRRDEARAALAAVYGAYTEGFTTPDLMDAAALLQELAPDPVEPTRPTKREQNSEDTPAHEVRVQRA